MKIKTPHLGNAVVLSKQFPNTFSAPSSDEISNLKIGSIVKICAICDNNKTKYVNSERFWVEITEINRKEFVGRIDNHLLFTKYHGLDYNGLVKFNRENIYAIYSENKLYPPYGFGMVRNDINLQ